MKAAALLPALPVLALGGPPPKSLDPHPDQAGGRSSGHCHPTGLGVDSKACAGD